MKNYILCMVAMVALAACVPAPVQDRGPSSGTRSGDFSIEPEGVWMPNCQNSGTTSGGVLAHQKKIVFSEKEPTFSLVHDFLDQICKKDKPTVVLRRHLNGKLVFGQHSNLDDGRRARVVEVEVSADSYTPKTDAGLKYLQQIVSTEVGSKLAIGKEFVVPKDYTPSKLYGMLVVKKNMRNAMHVYLVPQQRTAKDIAQHLDDSNLYVRHTTK